MATPNLTAPQKPETAAVIGRIFVQLGADILEVYVKNIHSQGEPETQAQSLTLTFGNYRLAVDRLGGRITEFVINNKNALITEGVQTGSTFWPSPQSLWDWPPPKALDEGSYSVLRRTETCLELQSAVDDSLGIRVNKCFRSIENGFQVEYTIINATDQSVTLAPWEISRTSGGLSFYAAQTPADPISTFATQFISDHYWYLYCVDELEASSKIFANSSDGWLANANNGLLFLKRFPRVDVNDVAPGEAEVEIYAHGEAESPYIELEQQGAFRTLAPAERVSWSVEWTLFEIPPAMDIRIGSQSLLDFTYEKLGLDNLDQ